MKTMCNSINHTRIPYKVSPTARSKPGQTRYKKGERVQKPKRGVIQILKMMVRTCVTYF